MISGTAQFVPAKVFTLAILEVQQAIANGAASVSKPVDFLPGNAVVDQFPVTIRAGRAAWTHSSNAAQLRQRDISTSGEKRTSVVLDFGVMRTEIGRAHV